jgi:predicted nucleotidyltransferase
MDMGNPTAAITPTLDGPVLSVLAGTTRPLTGRAIARLVPHGSQKGVQLVLNRLAEQGVISRQEAGQASLYELNRDHLAAPAAEALASLRAALLERLRNELATWRVRPHHASVFGSVARGDGDTASDVDLFIVRPKATVEENPIWRAQLDRLAREVRAWTGNEAAIIEISAGDVARLRADRPKVIDELDRDGIDISGRKLRTLLGAAR